MNLKNNIKLYKNIEDLPSAIFATNVREICKNNNISIGKLEREIGITVGYLSKVAKGVNVINLNDAVRISVYLNCSFDNLLDKNYSKNLRNKERIKEIEELSKKIKKLEKEME